MSAITHWFSSRTAACHPYTTDDTEKALSATPAASYETVSGDQPALQVQEKEPAVFAHAAFASQLCVASVHSSSSAQFGWKHPPTRGVST
eukprot:2344610-Rhodomonas_salina.1